MTRAILQIRIEIVWLCIAKYASFQHQDRAQNQMKHGIKMIINSKKLCSMLKRASKAQWEMLLNISPVGLFAQLNFPQCAALSCSKTEEGEVRPPLKGCCVIIITFLIYYTHNFKRSS